MTPNCCNCFYPPIRICSWFPKQRIISVTATRIILCAFTLEHLVIRPVGSNNKLFSGNNIFVGHPHLIISWIASIFNIADHQVIGSSLDNHYAIIHWPIKSTQMTISFWWNFFAMNFCWMMSHTAVTRKHLTPSDSDHFFVVLFITIASIWKEIRIKVPNKQ